MAPSLRELSAQPTEGVVIRQMFLYESNFISTVDRTRAIYSLGTHSCVPKNNAIKFNGTPGAAFPAKCPAQGSNHRPLCNFLFSRKCETAAFCVMAVGNSYVPLTFERIFRDPSGFALLSHLPLQGKQEVCGVDRGSFLTGTLVLQSAIR